MSDFDRTFLPFVDKKGVERAPVNRFLLLKNKKLEKAKARSSNQASTSKIADSDAMDLDVESMAPAGSSTTLVLLFSDSTRSVKLSDSVLLLFSRSPGLLPQDDPCLPTSRSGKVQLTSHQVRTHLPVRSRSHHQVAGRGDLRERGSSQDHGRAQGWTSLQEEAVAVPRGYSTCLLR